MKTLFSVVIFIISCSVLSGQLTVTAHPDTNQIRNQLQGNGVQIYNLELYADTIAYGLFQGNSELPISSGFAITTGNVNQMSGHCDSVFADSVLLHDNPLGWSETRDVDPNALYDYNRLSFSIVTVGDTLKVGFCFASEEYPRMYNDVGAIMISGPNPNGGQYDSVRLSWIATPGFPVCVMNYSPMVWQSYFNWYSTIPAQYESYSGGTVYAERKIAVVPGQPYYISLSVADAGDGNFDSGLFVEGFWSDSTLSMHPIVSDPFSLQPNPASDYISFHLSNEYTSRICFTDQLGRTVLIIEECSGVVLVPVSSLAEGVYCFTSIRSDGVVSNGKFIVEH